MDRNDRVGNNDDNNVHDINFDLDDLDSKNHDSEDEDGDGSDGNLGVFDFDEADVPQHNDRIHDDHEGSIGGPPFETLHTRQGFLFEHNVAMGTIENVGIEVDSLQPRSDSISFGEGDNVLAANEPTHIQHDSFPA